jgi:hypothetical protein
MLRTLTALLVAAAAACALAGPADAAQNDQPTDPNGKKSCKAYASGGDFWLNHGTRLTVTFTDDETGKKVKQTLRCDDGTWTRVLYRNPRLGSVGAVGGEGLPWLQAMPAAAGPAPRMGGR